MHKYTVITSSRLNREEMSKLVAEFGGETRTPDDSGMGDFIVTWRTKWRRHGGFLIIDLFEREAATESLYESPLLMSRVCSALGWPHLSLVVINVPGGNWEQVTEFSDAIVARFGGFGPSEEADAEWDRLLCQFSAFHRLEHCKEKSVVVDDHLAELSGEEFDAECENAQDAMIEWHNTGATNRRCLRCGGSLVIETGPWHWTVRCERDGCLTFSEQGSDCEIAAPVDKAAHPT